MVLLFGMRLVGLVVESVEVDWRVLAIVEKSLPTLFVLDKGVLNRVQQEHCFVSTGSENSILLLASAKLEGLLDRESLESPYTFFVFHP